ncbi:MAG: methyltransferase [Geminicoccaceae bacterium]
MAPLPPSPTLDRCKGAVMAPFALLAGMKLDLFTALAEGPADAKELAARLGGASAERLRGLLNGLAAIDILRAGPDGRFANSEEAEHYLVRGRPHFIGDQHKLLEDLWRGALLAAESIRNDKPMAAHDFAHMTPAQVEAFFEGQHPDGLLAGWKLADAVDFGGYRHLLDVAGGSGGISIALCERWPGLRATLLEPPTVLPIAERRVREAGLDGRIALQAADVIAAPLAGSFDVAVVRSFLQVLAPDEAAAAIRNIRPALAPGASIYVIGQMVDDDRRRPEGSALFDLVFLSFYEGGRVYTEGEQRAWLAAAGFERIERRLTPNGLNMITARVPG